MEAKLKVELTKEEKNICLRDIRRRIVRAIYVYEQSCVENSGYDYKVYIHSLMLYISSSNYLFDGELVSLIVYLNSILLNDFDKKQFKKTIFECKNYIDYLLGEGETNG